MSAHVSSARTVSIALMTITYFAIDLSTKNHRYVSQLSTAGEAVATYYASGYAQDAGIESWPEGSIETGFGSVSLPRQELGTHEWVRPTGEVFATVELKTERRRWILDIALPIDGGVARVGEEAVATLHGVADQMEIPTKDHQGLAPDALYSKLEGQLFGREVVLPVVDIPVGPQSGMWVLGAVSVLFLVMIRTGLRGAIKAADSGVEEPWLMLDGREGLERLVGDLWLLVVVASPLVIGVLVVLTSQDLMRTEVLRSPFNTWVSLIGAAVLFVTGLWAEVTVLGDVFALRTMREPKTPPAG